MTKREFYEAVINANVNDELTNYAREGLVALDHTNEVRKAATAKKALEKEAERAPIREAIVNAIGTEPKTATMLIEEAGVELKPQAMPSLLKSLIEAGVINKTQVKVPGKGKQVGYVRA